MQTRSTTVLLDGLRFTECPRWRDGRLWFVDMDAEQVMTVDPQGKAEVVLNVAGSPGGLGWDPQGRLLVVSMKNRQLHRYDGGRLELFAGLSGQEPYPINDMVVDRTGRAFIGSFGFDMTGGARFAPANVYTVAPDGTVGVAAPELRFPNGMVIAPDGGTLIVAESFGRRLTAFDLAPDGTLSGQRIFAELGEATPDGICLDAEGAVWVSSYRTSEFLRVREGGEVVDRVPVAGRSAVACMLGGDDGRTLFLCTAEVPPGGGPRVNSKSWIETVRVDVPHAGLP